MNLRLSLLLTALGFSLLAAPVGLAKQPARAASIAPGEVCIITHYEGDAGRYGRIAAANHAGYAARFGYRSHAFVGRVSGERFLDPSRGGPDDLFGGGLFWQKIAAVQQTLASGLPDAQGVMQPCSWVAWMDSDALFSNFGMALTDVIASFALRADGPKELVFAQERDHPINAGVFYVHNSAAGREFFRCTCRAVSALRGQLPARAERARRARLRHGAMGLVHGQPRFDA